MTLHSDGRYNEAEELLVRVMETRKRGLGEEHPDTLISMANLALTYSNQGQSKEAEKLLVQVIETEKRVLSKAHPDVLISKTNQPRGKIEQFQNLRRSLNIILVTNDKVYLRKVDAMLALNAYSSLITEQGRIRRGI